jgi:PEGA domain
MTRTTRLATPVLLATLICMAAPAGAAQRGGHSRGGGGGSVGRAAPRAGASRGASQRSFGSPRIASMAPRAIGPRTFGSRGFAIGPRVGVGRMSPRFVGRVGVVSPFRFARPFFTFRPRVSLGFGLWVGYPVAYPYYAYGYPYPYPYGYASAYPYPYPYSYPYPAPAYGYPSSGYPPANYPPPAQGSVGVQPGQTDSGGVSLEITPNTAAVYVDGQYVGTVANFAPTMAPLALTQGRHRLEVRSAGYETMTFDADVTPGQVIPFQGTMQPIRR